MFFFFFNDTATTEIYTLSLHDALPIYVHFHRCLGHIELAGDDLVGSPLSQALQDLGLAAGERADRQADRKSTRLNSSHANISYAVFCLKKKKIKTSSYTASHQTQHRIL